LLESASKLTLIHWWIVNIIIGIAIKISDATKCQPSHIIGWTVLL
jgi:hypothetical protein